MILSVAIAAVGLLILATRTGFIGLCTGLVVAGIGSSIQHPRGSKLVTDLYPLGSRQPLSVYNFSGDLGKAALPALVAVLLPILAWRSVACLMAGLGLALILVLPLLLPNDPANRDASPKSMPSIDGANRGFKLLTIIGALDTATRMGYLLFLPFLVHARGGGSPTVGIALALLFVGGAFGKATCGWLAEKVGVVESVMLTEAVTGVLIVATLFTPMTATLILLPLLGIVLNGTSSVLYGTVPEIAGGDTGKAFAFFYTSVIGAGGIAPILYGIVGDHGSRTAGIVAAALTAAAIVPLAWLLRPFLLPSGSDRHA